jgi:hypothetical protein
MQGVAEACGGKAASTIHAGRAVNGEGGGAVSIPPLSPMRVSGGALGEEGGVGGEDVVSEMGCSRGGRVLVKDNWGKGDKEELGPL